ncbi:hypothetical protein B5M09_000848 [Aphanomyces astaci]|uniref:5'-3' exonuclease domain-containing protein n=1 Tax=Aphanomyces astaci TaxID=112090 RepID=A0A3R7XV25_APHAT|nr:hypothetical protein B5M09_000848 [Aphanomyces astaci]
MTRNDQAIGAAVRFVQRVREIVHAKQANRLAIMFDTPQTSQRQLANDMYKPVHRKRTMAQHLRSQFPIAIDTLKALGVAVIQVPTVEADDLIASYAKACVADGFDVVIVTNDTDMYQLVQTSSLSDKVHHSVTVYRPMARQSIREARVKKLLCGGRPAQQPEIRALCGDLRGKTPGIPASQDKDKVEQDALIVRDVAMRTLKRRKDCELDELKRKSPTENRRNSLAASIEAEGERELLVREKELEFQRFKFEAELKERERLRGLDREEMKAERDHQVLLARIESEKMLTMFKAVAEAKK